MFQKLSWTQHLILALLLGFLARGLTAYYVYGSQSNDDYSHGLLPALAADNGVELKIPNWRSPLLVWTLTPAVSVGKALGIDTQFGLIRFVLFSLGVFSLLGVWAYGLYGRRLGGLIGLYLLSLHFIMTFGSTRAFGETIAVTFTLLAFLMIYASEDQSTERLERKSLFFLGCLSLGIACLYRFQVGVLAVGFGVYFAASRRWSQLALLTLAGLIAAGLQGMVDLNFGRKPLETLYNYLYINKDGATEHSDQPWFNTWLTLLPMWLFPFSIPLLRQIKKFSRTEFLWLALIAFFVALHSMIPHKEERFLFPIVPLMLILLAKLWNESWNQPWERWFFRPAVFIILPFGLFIATFSNSQSGEYEPFRQAEALRRPVILWDYESTLSESNFLWNFVGKQIQYQDVKRWPTAEELTGLNVNDALLVTSQENHLLELTPDPPGYSQLGWHCKAPVKIQSFADRMLYFMNPHFNWRRKATWLRHCHRGSEQDKNPKSVSL